MSFPLAPGIGGEGRVRGQLVGSQRPRVQSCYMLSAGSVLFAVLRRALVSAMKPWSDPGSRAGNTTGGHSCYLQSPKMRSSAEHDLAGGFGLILATQARISLVVGG